MNIIRTKPAFKDSRGVITDLLEGTPVDSIVILTTKKGSIRGNHYHKKTFQYSYVVDGKFRFFTQVNGGKVQKKVIRKGDLVVSAPNEKHAFEALEDSTLLAFCKGPRGGKQYEDDTYRLDVPLVSQGGQPRSGGRM